MSVTRGVVFSCYDVPGCQSVSATVEDGVIVAEVPDEMDATYARALAACIAAAADELERQEWPRGGVAVAEPAAGLTSKQAWWAGARAGLGLPADTPRPEVAEALAGRRK